MSDRFPLYFPADRVVNGTGATPSEALVAVEIADLAAALIALTSCAPEAFIELSALLFQDVSARAIAADAIQAIEGA